MGLLVSLLVLSALIFFHELLVSPTQVSPRSECSVVYTRRNDSGGSFVEMEVVEIAYFFFFPTP